MCGCETRWPQKNINFGDFSARKGEEDGKIKAAHPTPEMVVKINGRTSTKFPSFIKSTLRAPMRVAHIVRYQRDRG